MAGCSVSPPPGVFDQGQGELNQDAGAPVSTGGSGGTSGIGTNLDAGIVTGPIVVDAGQLPLPPPGCTEGATRPCGPTSVKGICKLGARTCKDGAWSECVGDVEPKARDCSSDLDNDCDGQPDDSETDTCRCRPTTTEPCDTHPGFDGHGPCTAGSRSCVVAADKLSSDWGECAGSVAPVPKDSCTVHGDDSNCDGTPNGGCACVEGDVIACGPPANVGICVRGTSTCVNGANTACAGAVVAKPRDCTSTADNDCDGVPDNTVDTLCTCLVGSTQACDQHTNSSGDPIDGVGICKAGTQTCILNTGTPGSAWGACTGAVAPAPRSCTSAADNDCDGVPDNTADTVCTCVIGTSQACDAHAGLDGHGNCRAGVQLCVAGASNSSSTWAACTGSVGPAGADSCTVAGDDSNCDGVPNSGCQCVGSNSANCTDPAASRCSSGQCVACSSASDCTHIAGMTACTLGVCQAGGTTTTP